MHAMRYLLIQLLLQVLLHPDEYWEAAVDVTICCKKSFPVIAQGDNSSAQESAEHGSQESDEDGSEESDEDGSEDPNEEVSLEFMDVLVQTFLSVLPHACGPVCFTIEQASILSCNLMD
jgi:DNA polymerase phi